MKFVWFLLGRLLQLVPVLIGITAVAFLLLRVMPGDPATLMLGARGNAEDIAALTRQLGLDRPLWQQYVGFLGDIATGSFGMSIASRRAVGAEMLDRLWPTLALVGLSTLIAVALTVPLALLSAVRRGRWADQAIKLVFIAAMSMPAFWLGLLLVLLLSIAVPIFPVSGYGDGFLGHLHHLVLPALVIGLGTAALTIRALRSSIIGVLGADYIDTARAKGLPERSVLLAPRAAQLADVVDLDPGGAHELGDRRHRRRRDGVRHPGPRPPAGLLDRGARLSGRAGPDRDLRAARRRDQPARRRRLRRGRSAPDAVLMSAPGAERWQRLAGNRNLQVGLGDARGAAPRRRVRPVAGALGPDRDRLRRRAAAPGRGASVRHRRARPRRAGARAGGDLRRPQVVAVCVVAAVLHRQPDRPRLGLFRRLVRSALMRLVDVLLAFPHYVLVIAIVGSLGPGIANLYLAFALVVWISFARIVRAEVLRRPRARVRAGGARCSATGMRAMMLRHILPNVITPSIVFMMSDVVLTILAVTSLGFLGLGIQPPTPSGA